LITWSIVGPVGTPLTMISMPESSKSTVSPWMVRAFHDGATWSWTCVGRKGADSKWHVGKFDWGRGDAGNMTKNTENIRGGYKGHTMYATNETILFGLVSTDGKLRSNWVEVKSE
jgi:hypothetical protein